jgi:hypothetical protein
MQKATEDEVRASFAQLVSKSPHEIEDPATKPLALTLSW